jgi:hypothetical protein
MSGEDIMAWIANASSAYIDQWDPELGNKRWYRKLDRDSATYLYRYDQTSPDQSTLFAAAGDAGAPQALASTDFLISDNTGPDLYDTALALTVDLAGALLDAGQHINAIQAAAGLRAGTVNDAVTTATERRTQVGIEQRPDQRKQLTRQGLRSIIDAAAGVANWVGLTAAVAAPYRNRLLSSTARITAIVTPLYAALQ